ARHALGAVTKVDDRQRWHRDGRDRAEGDAVRGGGARRCRSRWRGRACLPALKIAAGDCAQRQAEREQPPPHIQLDARRGEWLRPQPSDASWAATSVTTSPAALSFATVTTSGVSRYVWRMKSVQPMSAAGTRRRAKLV